MAELDLGPAIVRYKTNEDRFDRFMNGTALQTVITSGGQAFPTIRKFLADKNAEINIATDGILAQVIQARQTTLGYRDAAQGFAQAAAQSAEDAAQFDPSSYYNKSYIDTALSQKEAVGHSYSKSEIDVSQATQDADIAGRMLNTRDVAAGTGITKTGTLNGGNLSLAVTKATAAEITSGVANKFPDAVAVRDAIASISPVLFGGAYTNVTLPVNTTRQNITGKPLFVTVVTDTGTSGVAMSIRVGSSSVFSANPVMAGTVTSSAAVFTVNCAAIVAPGEYYSYNSATVAVVREKS